MRPDADTLLQEIAEYVSNYVPTSELALDTAALCLADSLGCAIRALDVAECEALLGPVVPGTVVPGGIPIPGTPHVLDPVTAAFNMGMITEIRILPPFSEGRGPSLRK